MAKRRKKAVRHCSKCGSVAHDARYHAARRAVRRNPDDIATVARQSRTFHGGLVDRVELTAKERKLPRNLVVLGELTNIGYRPNPRSSRGKYDWNHKAGDRGIGRNPARGKALVAADPVTGRPVIVHQTSSMRLKPTHGLVG